jgi:hypothetical protein
MPDSEAVLASITWHFMVGNDRLTRSQCAEHETRGACPECEGKSLPALAARAEVPGG